MLTKLPHIVPQTLIDTALDQILNNTFRFTINEPTGRFFYDPWVIKESLKDSAWNDILNTLPTDIGEARIIILKPGTCYQIHADIDDRYHLNLQGHYYRVIDFDNDEMHEIINDGHWYLMDAGRSHSAANFGRIDRVQLVVRKLLSNSSNNTNIKIKISPKINQDTARFIFDNTVSSWLNYAVKENKISNFEFVNSEVTFAIEEHTLKELEELIDDRYFKLEVLV